MKWIITANTNLCRIYQFDKHGAKVVLLKEINHPENRQKTGGNASHWINRVVPPRQRMPPSCSSCAEPKQTFPRA